MIIEPSSLSDQSAAAFDAAFQAFEQRPAAGSADWKLWRQLCRQAVEANTRYHQSMSSAIQPSAIRDSDS
jgi:hypothetical protein